MKKNFEEYFSKKFKEDQDILKGLEYSEDQIREIYKNEFEYRESRPKLDLQLDSQKMNYELVQSYFPEKWEMLREGKLLGNYEELVDALKLIIYNLGVRKSLDEIPRKLIEEYLEELN